MWSHSRNSLFFSGLLADAVVVIRWKLCTGMHAYIFCTLMKEIKEAEIKKKLNFNFFSNIFSLLHASFFFFFASILLLFAIVLDCTGMEKDKPISNSRVGRISNKISCNKWNFQSDEMKFLFLLYTLKHGKDVDESFSLWHKAAIQSWDKNKILNLAKIMNYDPLVNYWAKVKL